MNPLQKAAQDRDISYLLHFTRLVNLSSIMKRGLMPGSQLEAKGIEVTFNDDERIDNCPNATCLSVVFPNYKMFWAYRQSFSNVKWIVLAIEPRVLWEKNCTFCHENAASNAVTCIPLHKRKGLHAFNRLYDEIDSKPSRKKLGISDGAPTSPQAEVLVFDVIETELIMAVLVENQAVADEAKKVHSEIEILIKPAFFKARKDYMHWKKI